MRSPNAVDFNSERRRFPVPLEVSDLSEKVWVATEGPRIYRKMVGSKSGIRLCTYCYEEDEKIVYGEYEVYPANPGGKVLVCHEHRERLKAEGGIPNGR